MTTRSLRRPTHTVLAILTFGLAVASAQAPITWTVSDLKDKNDVSTKGKLCIAANLGPEVCEKVVNGVHFQADRSHWTRKIVTRNGPVVRGVMHFPEFTSGGYVLKVPYDRTAGGIGARHATDTVYDFILKDARHTSPAPRALTCSVEGLTPGQMYEIQIFYGNKGRPTRITEWDNGVGGREGKGGIFLRASGPHFGQVATGTFTATASGKQTFTNHQQPADNTQNPPLKLTHNACSAIQIRELNPKPARARATYYGEGTPGTNTQPLLGGSKCSPAIALSGHPKINTTVTLTCENSQDVASVAVFIFGFQPANAKVEGGTLLVTPAVVLPVAMPAPASPYVHDHELQVPWPMQSAPSGRPFYVQFVQFDKGAPGGLSFTPGMAIEIGL